VQSNAPNQSFGKSPEGMVSQNMLPEREIAYMNSMVARASEPLSDIEI